MSRNIEPQESVDAYITAFPQEIKEKLIEMRELIHSAEPRVGEKISWGMPTFTLNGKALVHFAAQKAHVGFYPAPETILHFQSRLSEYKTTKGGIQLPYKKPIPTELIKDMVKFRAIILTQ